MPSKIILLKRIIEEITDIINLNTYYRVKVLIIIVIIHK
jgi:hypothetical protein